MTSTYADGIAELCDRLNAGGWWSWAEALRGAKAADLPEAARAAASKCAADIAAAWAPEDFAAFAGLPGELRAWAEAASLTRAEEAYAHLASFQRGQAVEVSSRYGDFVAVGTVTTAQQHDHADINRAYLIVTSGNASFRVTVGSLLSGRHAITAQS